MPKPIRSRSIGTHTMDHVAGHLPATQSPPVLQSAAHLAVDITRLWTEANEWQYLVDGRIALNV